MDQDLSLNRSHDTLSVIHEFKFFKGAQNFDSKNAVGRWPPRNLKFGETTPVT